MRFRIMQALLKNKSINCLILGKIRVNTYLCPGIKKFIFCFQKIKSQLICLTDQLAFDQLYNTVTA